MLDTLKKYKYEAVVGFMAVFAFVFRMIYVTLNKGLWWDSASFLIMTQRILGKTTCVWEAHRLPGFPILMTPVYLLFGMNPVVFRVVEILFVAGTVVAVYLLAAEMFKNKNIGLAAAIFIALSWLNFFYSLRILSRVPGALFVVIGIYLFWTGYNSKNWKKMLGAGLAFGFYYLIRFDLIFILGAIGIFVLIDFIRTKEKKAFIKRKDLWIFAGGILVFVIPYMIWQAASFGSPIHQFHLTYELTKDYGETYFDQFKLMPHIFSTGWLIFFVLGLIFCAVNIKKREYLLILMISLFFFAGIMASPHHEDRYSLPILPIWGIVSGIGLIAVVNTVFKKEYFRMGVCIGIALILGILCMNYGWGIIQSKGPSYGSVQESGIALNYFPQDIIYAPSSIGAPIPQLCVWADKEYKLYPDTMETFLSEFREGELAYCSIGYDSCPSYLLPRVSNNEELQAVLQSLESRGITVFRFYQDGVGGISVFFEKVVQNNSLTENAQK